MPEESSQPCETRQSSIVVAVRVRPFTATEEAHLVSNGGPVHNYQLGDTNLTLPGVEPQASAHPISIGPGRFKPHGLRRILECVDDKMLVFDPAESNPLSRISETVLNSLGSAPSGNGSSGASGTAAAAAAARHGTGRRNGEQKFVFDKVFGVNSTQLEIYEETTQPLLDAVLDGFNSTVFAYGATGCGKTYTVSGTPDHPGLVFLTMQELFQRIESLQDSKRFELSASYLEIYNESIRDLLNPEMPPKKLVLREDVNRRITVANLSHHPLTNVQEVMDLVVRGNLCRTTSATDANETSSRSHAVLQVHITQRNRTAEITENHKFAALSIIDLAGSERASATKNRGERLHEGANINRSLLALGNCINALCVQGRRGTGCHVPYRDSKLTRLLKFSLGGNCKTVMIVCVSPSSSHYDETLNTLKYATRAKEIKTKVIRNQQSLDRHVGSYLKLITEQRQEIDELRRRERRMIELQLTQYKISREKVQLAIWDKVQVLQDNYRILEKFRHAKLKKSLTLCKRRYLQLLQMEVSVLLNRIEKNSDLFQDCSGIYDQLSEKIVDLERSFDATDDLDAALTNSREVDLTKLQEMEGWLENSDLHLYDTLLAGVSDAVKNDILVNSSVLMEKLLQDPLLTDRAKFLSTALLADDDGADSGDSLDHQLHAALRTLVQIDDEFERFAENVNLSTTMDLGGSFPADQTLRRFVASPRISKIRSNAALPAQRRPYKNNKKVRWSEPTIVEPTVVENEPSMIVDDDNTNTTEVNDNTILDPEEDVSMQDVPRGSETIDYEMNSPRGGIKPRKVSLTKTTLLRGR
ncbi:LAMI_0D02652g1_1 [Lachancea mirantina]|uniref:LAMI_0D02652g1_1 n=1 Tax=Lachancea mirantina TaxID=1230905 RepID=A0A1G4J9T9_9SACH|nr:LAMI_0D02652g1_1 [Lachancea mirantina]